MRCRALIGAAALAVALTWTGSALASASGVVISELRFRGPAGGNDEYVELTNAGSGPVDIGGWKLQGCAAASGIASDRSVVPAGVVLQTGEHYLFVNNNSTGGYSGTVPGDRTYGTGIGDGTGARIVNSGGTVIDGVGGDGVGGTQCREGIGIAGMPTTNGDQSYERKLNGTLDTDNNASDFAGPKAGNPQNHQATPAPPLRIHELQSAGLLSPKAGQPVTNVEGIVTLKLSNGFFMQDPQPDADPATSEGIFVFGSIPAGRVAVGDLVHVNGTVQEFPGTGSAASTNLTVTEIGNTSIAQVVSHGNALPAPVVWSPPSQVIEDDGLLVVDPVNDGLDYAESLEGMLVEIDDPVATGPSVDFASSHTTEVPLVNAAAGLRTPRGGIVLRPDDFNPERLILQGVLGTISPVSTADHVAGPVVGALDYNFGNYKLRPTATPTFVPGGLQQETTAAPAANQLSVATFNVENLDPSDGPTKFDRLAHILVDNLHAPDLVALEEVQDDNGAVDNGTTSSNVTLDTLVAAIEAAGGPAYEYRYVEPVNDQDGGEPGGNIRVVFLYRTDRGLAFVDRPGAGPTTANDVVGTGADTALAYSPGRIDPASDAWTSSRKPLAAELTYNGHRLFVIANHFNSKGGDDPLFGKFQPPVNSSETQRHKQAHEVADFVGKITAADPTANVVVLGDLNDFQFSETISILESAGLTDLVKTLPEDEQYTYDFDGNSQAIDHILLGGNLLDHAEPSYDAVHVNAEFANHASDHDPQVVLLTLAKPVILADRAPAPNAAGWNAGDVTVTFTCVDPLSSIVACPAPVTVSTEGAGQSVTRSSATKGGDTVSATVDGISIDKTNPVVTYAGNQGTYGVDERVQITCTASDALSGVASTTCSNVDEPAWQAGPGSHTLSATADDRAGNTGSGTTTYTVTVSPASLCRLILQLVSKPGVANSLCVKLDHAPFAAFAHEVEAQSGKSLTEADAATLTSLALALPEGRS